MQTEISETKSYVIKSGKVKYYIEVEHKGLHRFKEITADDRRIAFQKAMSVARQWDDIWNKQVADGNRRNNMLDKQQQAEQRTTVAREGFEALSNILAHTLRINDAVDWELLKNKFDYSISSPIHATLPPKPSPQDEKYNVKSGFLDNLMGRTQAKRQAAQELYEKDLRDWEKISEIITTKYQAELAQWTQNKQAYLDERDATNAVIDAQKADYQRGNDPQAIMDYCDLVLSRSQYPDYFPQSYELDYTLDNRMLVVNYQLPSVQDLPTLREVKYVASRNEFTEKHVSESQLKQIYDNLLYQITLRTLHELFEADRINAIDSIVFNGFVHALNPATGKSQDVCVLSIQASKAMFEDINLAKIEPKACFRSLKGVGSSKLHSYAAVAPVVAMNKEDKRFVPSYDVAGTIQEGDNLANMPWEDFEHLIREIFEREFASSGGEVKVTRASRDAGVDAVVFDPDPLRGGKFVIQAKRYNNTVGVSAVRDLWGTVMNEGAARGILVTTSNYGSDAYEFASNKPITLLNGSNLLHMLEKHGHKARIDLNEAKKS